MPKFRRERDPFADARAENGHNDTGPIETREKLTNDHNDQTPARNDSRSHAHAHTHSHTHGPQTSASKRLQRLIAAVLIPLATVSLVGLVMLWPRDRATTSQANTTNGPRLNDLVNATVVDTDLAPCTGVDSDLGNSCLAVESRLASGQLTTILNTVGPFQPRIRIGDKIVLVKAIPGDDGNANAYAFYGFQRRVPLVLLGLMFLGLAIAIGRGRGVRALIGLVITLFLLLRFALPAIAGGRNPLTVSIVMASVVMLVALYLAHGLNARTSCAVIGTLVSLVVTGVLAQLFTAASHFTGLGSDELNYLRTISPDINASGLLLAGIIIGSLGILDDVTVTQASAVWEIHQADPTVGFAKLYGAAMRIGRDHIASTINTLVLAYAGAALPLLLLFTETGARWREVALEESVATEIVRTLVGSIGLMSSVPVTTALTALLVVRERVSAAESST